MVSPVMKFLTGTSFVCFVCFAFAIYFSCSGTASRDGSSGSSLGEDPAAAQFIRRYWQKDIAVDAAPADPKTALQEWAQARSLELPDYSIASRAGPPHAPEFTVMVSVGGRQGVGTARSKRAAEQLAAQDLLQGAK